MTEPTPLEQGAAAYKQRHHTETPTDTQSTTPAKTGRDTYARRHPNQEKN